MRNNERVLTITLSTGCAGLLTFVAGLCLDAVIHALHPDLAETESLLTLSNPGHLLLFLGAGMIALGILGTTLGELQRFQPRWWQLRLLRIASGISLVVVCGATAGVLQWAAAHDDHTSPVALAALPDSDISPRALQAVASADDGVVVLRAAAATLNLSQDQLAGTLWAGEPLNQIAASRGVALVQIQVDARRALAPVLEQEVQDGVLTAADADAILSQDPLQLLPSPRAVTGRPTSPTSA